MTIYWMDGFDYLAASQISRRWTGAGNPASVQSGRISGQCARFGSGNFSISSGFGNRSTAVVGLAFRTSAFVNAGTIVSFYDLTSTQCDLRTDASGHLYFTQNGTQRGSASTNVLTTNTWYYIEFKAIFGGSSSGTCEVRVAETVWATATGVTNITTANAYANAIRIANYGAATVDYDDIYVADAYQGDCRIETLMPSGAGTTSQWTASSGSNYQCVDEAQANDDTDYVSDSTIGHKDTYAYGNLASVSGVVKAVQTVADARIDTAGTRSVAFVTRSGGSEHDSSDVALGSVSYALYTDLQQQNPVSSTTWTISDVNAAEFGIKVTA